MSWDSDHHLEHKRSVVMTPLRRAEKVVSDTGEREKEVDRIKKVLAMNGYKQ